MTGYRERYRFFISLLFYFDRDEALALEKLQDKFGSYDYFTRPFLCPGEDIMTRAYPAASSRIQNQLKGRHIGFTQLQSYEKAEKIYRAALKLEGILSGKKNALVILLPGFLSAQKVIAFHRFEDTFRTPLAGEGFSQVELTWNENRFKEYPGTSSLFQMNKSLTFFTDLRRLLQQD